MCLEASTKPPIHNLIHEFLVNMAFTMACPNFKKGLKMVFGPLGVKRVSKYQLTMNFKKCIHFAPHRCNCCTYFCFYSFILTPKELSSFWR
jgi:hypothetical protein